MQDERPIVVAAPGGEGDSAAAGSWASRDGRVEVWGFPDTLLLSEAICFFFNCPKTGEKMNWN